MSTGVIPNLFAIWRKSVLFTVGAISLGAEQLEQQIKRILKPADRDRATRVKVPVRGSRVATPAVTRRNARNVRGVRKATVTRSAKSARVTRKAPGRRPRVKITSDHSPAVAPAIAEARAHNK